MKTKISLNLVALALLFVASTPAIAADTVLRVVVVETDDVGEYVKRIEQGKALLKKAGSPAMLRIWQAGFAGPDTGSVVVSLEYEKPSGPRSRHGQGLQTMQSSRAGSWVWTESARSSPIASTGSFDVKGASKSRPLGGAGASGESASPAVLLERRRPSSWTFYRYVQRARDSLLRLGRENRAIDLPTVNSPARVFGALPAHGFPALRTLSSLRPESLAYCRRNR